MKSEWVEEKNQTHFLLCVQYMTDEMIRFWYVEIDLKSKISM